VAAMMDHGAVAAMAGGAGAAVASMNGHAAASARAIAFVTVTMEQPAQEAPTTAAIAIAIAATAARARNNVAGAATACDHMMSAAAGAHGAAAPGATMTITRASCTGAAVTAVSPAMAEVRRLRATAEGHHQHNAVHWKTSSRKGKPTHAISKASRPGAACFATCPWPVRSF
jgi:hypothetical protein